MSKPKIDRTEAPEGYRAYRHSGKKGYFCTDCALLGDECSKGPAVSCSARDRADGCEVIFRRLENDGAK